MNEVHCFFLRWGCTHEKGALEAYANKQKHQHTNFILEDAGLLISMERPYIGASPDAIVTCECFEKGTVEVKCHFCYKDCFPEDDNPSNFCMTKDSSGMASYMAISV